ncbi:MAG: hypothetical protein CMB56_002270 [Methanobacteriota archaeon]|nr:MAG: hypothetical protein CMB56_002270 [Euryarchaeota archaeon]
MSRNFKHSKVLILCLVLFCSVFSSIIISDYDKDELEKVNFSNFSPAFDQDYRFYFDSMTQDDVDSNNYENGIDGKITTKEPTGGMTEKSITDGTTTFSTRYLLSDINVTGSNNEILFNLFYQFEGPEGATATIEAILMSGDSIIKTVSEDLENPCSGFGFGGDSCGDPDDETLIFENVGTTLVSADSYLKVVLQVVSTNGCDAQFSSCDIKVYYGNIENDNQETYLSVRTNTLAGSEIRVHEVGAGWNDVEKIQWYPNDSDEDRQIQLSVDIRSAFGRSDISDVELVIDDVDGIENVEKFSYAFSNSDLKLDNGGLVGDVIFTYGKGDLEAGSYPIELRVTDLQHNQPVIFTHEPIISNKYGIDFELGEGQSEKLLVAPGQTSRLEFGLTHIGYLDNSMSVELSIQPPLTSDWQVEFDQPVGGYQLAYGGTSIKPTVLIKAPDDDMSTTPEKLNIIAVPKVNNSQVTDVSQILIDVEQIDVYSDPRLSLYEDNDFKIQIGDSEDESGDFDTEASNFVYYEGFGEFYLNVLNTGFDSDTFRMKFTEIPDQWDAAFVDNSSKEAIIKEQGAFPTGEINSSLFKTILVEVYPPIDRSSPDIGKISIEVTSSNDLSLRATLSFTVQRTFGVHSTVIYDCDASPLGFVNSDISTCENPQFNDETFRLKITSSAKESDTKISTFQLKNPGLLDKMITTPDGQLVSQKDYYGTWDFQIFDINSSLASNVKLSSGDSTEIKLLITPSMGMLSGNHTIYFRVIEEVDVDSGNSPKYFDMPLTIFVGEDLPQIEITQTSANELIGVNSFEEIEMRIYNVANVETLVLLKLESSIGDNWRVTLESEDGGELLTVSPFSEKNFTIRVESPSCMRHNEIYDFEITAKPLDMNEAFGEEFTTTKSVRIQTNVESIPCRIQSELFSEPDPVTLGVLGSIILMTVVWFSRRGVVSEPNYFDTDELENTEEESIEINDLDVEESEMDDLPEPVVYEEVELVDED